MLVVITINILYFLTYFYYTYVVKITDIYYIYVVRILVLRPRGEHEIKTKKTCQKAT